MIIGLMGYAQVGKDTVAEYLTDEQHRFERRAFADALRQCLYALNPIVPDTGGRTMRRLAALVDRSGWDHVKVCYPEVRALLQRMGTEVGRNIIDQNIWVDVAMKDVGATNFVFTDVRFPNEYEAIRAAGGRLWRVERPGFEPVNAHPSETALDGGGYRADRLIYNHGTIVELWNQVQDALEELSI